MDFNSTDYFMRPQDTGSQGMGDRGLGSSTDGTAGGYTGGPAGYQLPPNSAGGTGTDPTNSTNSSNGGFWNSILGFLGSNGNPGDLTNLQGPISAAALAAAYQQYQNAGQYQQLGQNAAAAADPFSSQRAQYQQKLSQLESDPNGYLKNSPDYQAALGQGIGALDSSMSAKGFAGSGQAADEAQKYGSTLAAQYLNQDRQSLMQMSGANFAPYTAGNLLMQGGQLGVQSQNAALGDMFLPLMYAAAAQQRGNSPTNPAGGYNGIGNAVNSASKINLPTFGGGGSGGSNGLPDGYTVDPNTGQILDPTGADTGQSAWGPGDNSYAPPVGGYDPNYWLNGGGYDY